MKSYTLLQLGLEELFAKHDNKIMIQ